MLRTSLLIIASLLAVATAGAQALDGRLKRIADTKTITIAHRTDAAPFSFVDANKEITGYSVDLCKRIVASIERQIGVTGLKVKYVPVTAQNRFDAITKGQADMECGATTVSLSRMKMVDFSNFIFFETTGLMAKSASALQSLTDLKGKRIAVISGTTNERAVNTQLKRQQITATIVPMKTSQEAISALETGTVDAFASDTLLLIGSVTQAKDPKAMMLMNDQLSFEPYGIVLPRGDYAFRLAVNTGLSQIYSGDEINDIYNRWFAPFGKPSALTEAVYVFGSLPE
ncbi:MAG: amino acid ABC transporter substrate-binding protein [Betaproteobacteria bacterium]